MGITTGVLTGSLLLLCTAIWRLFRQRQACLLQAKVLAATSCSVAVTDATTPRHPVIYVNPAFRLLTGYADGDMLGQTMAILAGPDTDHASVEKLTLALQDGRACRVRLLHYRKNGTSFLNEVTLSPVKNRAGRLTSVIWVMSDVTPCQQEEEQARQGAAKENDGAAQFRAAVESAPCGMLMVSQGGLISMVNAKIEQMFGYRREELLGRPVECLLPARDRSLHHVARTEFLSSPAARPMGVGRELCGLRKNGSEFPVEVGLNPVSMDSETSVLATVIDITDRRRTEQAIRESDERLDLAVHAAHVGIFEHDHRTDTLYWSPILRNIFGVSADEPSSLQRYVEIIHRPDRERILSAIRAAHDPAGDGRLQVEHQIVWPDGDIRHVSLHSLTRFEGAGPTRTPSRTIGMVVDITDRKIAEARQRDLSKMEALGTLAGGIAHEFNNSLTAVLGFSQLALPLIPADNKAYHHIEQVLAAGRRSRELVHQLLTFSRQSNQSRRPISLHSLVKESLKLLRPTIPSWIELREQITKLASPIEADATQMHQVLLNLVDNALHAMQSVGGVLDIQLQDKEFSTDQVTPYGRITAGHYVCLSVKDSGGSIELEEGGEGRGMVPSVVHGIVSAHGGTVLVESEPGLGTTVSVYLPALLARPSSVPA